MPPGAELTESDAVQVLHVDDEPDFAELVATFLQREDERLDVETATSVEDGLALLSETDIDCVVSDYELPGRNGIEFLEAVRESHPNMPFILYTGKGSEEVASEAISAGVDDYLQKAAGTEQYTLLANRISNAVAQHRSRQEAARTRRFFSTLIEHSTDVIPVIDPEGTITYLSPSAEWILGYEPAEIVGENAFDYIHPDDIDRTAEKFRATLKRPDSMQEVEFRFKHADGSWVHLYGRARNLLDDPDIEGIVSYNRLAED